MKRIDYILDRITMYKLILYILSFFWAITVVLGFFRILPHSPLAIIFSTTVLITVSYIANKIFSFVFKAITNSDSSYITALILVFLLTPSFSFGNLIILTLTAVIAMLSKYILAIGKKHIFNPAAISLVITPFFVNNSASWWIGTTIMVPFLIIGGLLLVRKINRELMVFGFFASSFVSLIIFGLFSHDNLFIVFKNIFLNPRFCFWHSLC